MIMKNKIVNAAILLSLLTMISKILGFLRELVISYVYGASAMSDAYTMANSVVVLLAIVVANGIGMAYIPIYMGLNSVEEKNKFTNSLFTITITVTFFLALLSSLFARQVVEVIGYGFADETQKYTVEIIRFTFLAIVCLLVVYICNAYLNTKERFAFTGIQLILTNLILIIAILWSINNPIRLGLGYFVAYAIPALIGIFWLKKCGFVFKIIYDFKNSKLNELYLTVIISVIGTNVTKFNVMLDRIFVSGMTEGTVAAINYAYTLTSLSPEIFAVTIATVIYPKLALWTAQKERESFYTLLSTSINTISILLVPITVLFIKFGKEIVEILFQRGAFNIQDTILTVNVMNGYAFGMFGSSICYLLVNAYFAQNQKRIPTICFGVGIVIKLFVDSILTKFESGYVGIAYSTSIIITLIGFVLLTHTCYNAGKFYVKRIISVIAKVCLSSAIMLLGMNYFGNYVFDNNMINILDKLVYLTTTTIVGGCIYIVMLFVLRVEELKSMKNLFKR